MKQFCRMLTLPNEDSYQIIGYWLGRFLQDTGLDKNFPHLSEMDPVSHTLSRQFPLHQHMLDTFMDSVARGKVRNSNVSVVTPKENYKSWISSLLTPPKVEPKFPVVNFQDLVYPRMNHAVLETRQGMIHGLYKNKDGLFQTILYSRGLEWVQYCFAFTVYINYKVKQLS